jgi:ABC-2 type transport system ATP-binding protein
MIGRLYHLSRTDAKRRANELLERFDLVKAATRPAKTYSGGMRRRLDLAASLILPLPVLFLDEPTTGLDIQSRLTVWELVREVVASGTTVLLTTQYLEEADQLAHQIVVIEGGQVIARGTPNELKEQVGGERLELTIARRDDLDAARRVLQSYGSVQVDDEQRLLTVPVTHGSRLLSSVVRELDTIDVQLEDLRLRLPTLDDAFLTLTGHKTEQDAVKQTKQAVQDNKKKIKKEVVSK